MNMEAVREKLHWSKPTVRKLSAAEVLRMLAQDAARRRRGDQRVTVKPSRA